MRNFLRFLVFWFDILLLRVPSLGVQAFKRFDLIYGGLALLIGTSVAASIQLIPWWAIFVVLLVFGWMWSVYTKFQEVQDKNDELEEKLAITKKRRALKDLLGRAVSRGKLLLDENPTQHEALEWGQQTHDLVMDALTTAEAEFLLAGASEDTATSIPAPTDAQEWMEYRMDRIMQLSQELHNYDISPDFNPDDYPQDWMK